MRRGGITRVDPVNQKTTDRDQRHMLDWRRYNGPDQVSQETSGPSDQESRDAILSVFKTPIYGSNRGRPSRSDGHDLFETVHDGPFHRNRRSKRSDGYDQEPFK